LRRHPQKFLFALTRTLAGYHFIKYTADIMVPRLTFLEAELEQKRKPARLAGEASIDSKLLSSARVLADWYAFVFNHPHIHVNESLFPGWYSVSGYFDWNMPPRKGHIRDYAGDTRLSG